MKWMYFPDLNNGIVCLLTTDLVVRLIGVWNTQSKYQENCCEVATCLIWKASLVWKMVLALVGKVELGNTLGLRMQANTSGVWAEQALPALGARAGISGPWSRAGTSGGLSATCRLEQLPAGRPGGCGDAPRLLLPLLEAQRPQALWLWLWLWLWLPCGEPAGRPKPRESSCSPSEGQGM